jgi:nucleotide-binding universal stress UspA family protein
VRPIIVVGLGGSRGWHALAWATDEAAATRGRLVVCHACQPDSPLARPGTAPSIALLELIDPALARAVATARSRLGGDRVTMRTAPGRPGRLLLDAAANADLVVVGAPGWSALGGMGSTAHRVAAHAPSPVVVVRTAVPGRDEPFAGHVVVGVDDSPAARAALEFGFAYADSHRRPLAAVHVATDGWQDVRHDASTLPTQVEESRGERLLATEVEPWMSKYPAVAVNPALYAGRPLPGLLRAASGAHLLVVGDHRHGAAVRAVLGTVSDGAIDAAGCPVAVVPGYERRGETP